jgi:hypothetical protein
MTKSLSALDLFQLTVVYLQNKQIPIKLLNKV